MSNTTDNVALAKQIESCDKKAEGLSEKDINAVAQNLDETHGISPLVSANRRFTQNLANYGISRQFENKKARELGIPVISEEEFLKL